MVIHPGQILRGEDAKIFAQQQKEIFGGIFTKLWAFLKRDNNLEKVTDALGGYKNTHLFMKSKYDREAKGYKEHSSGNYSSSLLTSVVSLLAISCCAYVIYNRYYNKKVEVPVVEVELQSLTENTKEKNFSPNECQINLG